MAKRLEGGSSSNKEAKYTQHYENLKATKARRLAKRDSNRERWAKDEEYQERNRLRAIELGRQSDEL